MAKLERIRQEAPASFGPDDIARQAEQGWKLVALEWERELPETESAAPAPRSPSDNRETARRLAGPPDNLVHS